MTKKCMDSLECLAPCPFLKQSNIIEFSKRCFSNL